MNVSFSKNPEMPAQPVIEVQTVPTPVEGVAIDSVNTHVAVCHPQNVQVPAVASAPSGLIFNDKLPEFKDLILPRLNLVQGSGELKNSFPFGSIVFNQSLVLYAPPIINNKTQTIEKPGTPPITLTVLGFRPTRFAEKIAGGERGLLLDSEAAVRAAGGTLSYQEWNLKKDSGIKRFDYLAEAVVVIERPECVTDDDTAFVYPIEGKKLALGLWSLKGTGYTFAKRAFFTARAMGCLREGYPTWSFSVSTRMETSHGNTYVVPVALPCKKSSPAFLEFAASILNAA